MTYQQYRAVRRLVHSCCNYQDGNQHEDSDFLVGDTVILVVQRHDLEKRQMYGKILSKW